MFDFRCGTISLLLLSFVLAGCAKTEPVKAEIPLVRVQTITTAAADQSASYSGEVRGRYETQLAFQVSGKVIRRNVELGSIVQPGDVLMEIDTKDIQQTVNISSAQVASAQSQLNLAKTNLERYRQLYEQGAVSRAQLDQFQNTYDVALAAVRQSSAQHTQGINMLGYSKLSAETAGIIAGVNVETGQVVSAGQPVLTLVQGDEREIEFFIPEHRVEELRSAQKIDIRFWALPEVVAEGRVREISPAADKISRTYKVRVSMNSLPAGVKLGMTANVTVAKPAGTPAIYIPLSAIYQTGDTPNVWVINNGTVNLQPIKIGAFGDDKVQVVAGLKAGDIIVTAGVQKLRAGQRVRYNE